MAFAIAERSNIVDLQTIDTSFYFSSVIYEESFKRYPNGTIETNFRELRGSTCGLDFPYHDKQLIIDNNINNFFWVEDYDYSVYGSTETDEFKMIHIQVQFWDESVREWARFQDIIDLISSIRFDIKIIDRFFDPTNFDQPIQAYFKDDFSYYLIPGIYKSAQIYIQENEVETSDNFFSLDSSKKDIFYATSKTRIDLRSSNDRDKILLKASLRLDQEVKTHKRTVFTIFDLLGQIGGIFGLMQSFWLLFVGIYSQRMLTYSVLKKWYTMPVNYQNDENTEDTPQILRKRSTFYTKNNESPNLGKSPTPEKLGSAQKVNNLKNADNPDGIPQQNEGSGPRYLSMKEADNLRESMKQTKRFTYNSTDFICNLFSCSVFSKLCCK